MNRKNTEAHANSTTDRKPPRHPHLVKASIFAFVFVVFLLATSALGGYQVQVDRNPPPGANAEIFGELPSEWRWRPQGAELGHIYRQHAPARVDWIQEGSGTQYRR